MATNQIIPLPEHESSLALAGQVADAVAQAQVFDDYRERKAPNTRRRQDADLKLFAKYLVAVQAIEAVRRDSHAAALATQADAWAGVTWGLVAGFVRWQLGQGYAVSSANVRLSTVKTYAKLAFKAGGIDDTTYALIKAVSGYRRTEAKHIDEQRETEGVARRVGHKKAEARSISRKQANRLKDQPGTPQGRRDALLMALLLEHGLRCGEVALLQVTDFDLDADARAGTFTFYRPKVDKEQTHQLTRDSYRAVKAWLDWGDAPAAGPLLRGSRKGGKLTEAGLSVRAITKRVQVLGEDVGLYGLSAHDCRHYWATTAAANGTDPFALQEGGGWNSLAMPRRYVEAARIANEGVKLD